MSEWDGFDNLNDENAEVVVESTSAEENTVAEVVVENVPSEGSASTDAVIPYNSSPHGDNSHNYYGGQMPPGSGGGSLYNNDSYSSQYNDQYNSQYGNNSYSGSQYNSDPYSNNQYNNNPYNSNPYGSSQYNNNPYNNNPYSSSQYNNNPYNNNPYGSSQYNNNPNNSNPYSGSQYNNNPNNGNPYSSSQYNNNPNNSNPYSNNQNNNPYNNNPYNNNLYNNNSYNNSQYNNNQYNNPQFGNNFYGNNQYGNNPYSPYAVPPQKNKNGLIIGIVIGIVVLFSIAVFALIYRMITLVGQGNVGIRNDRSEYQFDYDEDDWGINGHRGYDDWYDDHDYDDWHHYYNDDSQYYELHNDIREDLSYSADMDYYEYDTDNENVDIWAEYPIIQGGNVPNTDKLNDVIRSEVDSYISYFKEGYEEYIADDDYYEVSITGYVTYMDEDKMSIVFDERVYSDEYSGYIDFYLCCINIDMENGVVLENQNLLRIDDDFSVDFRERSDIQNGESYYISMMSDQEITDYFNSADIIVFYTPMGMEIGFNYEEGWITVTYNEYEQYLKVF